jgi:hypothetical protein
VTEDKTPLEQAVETALYAPIGFAFEAKRLLPEFIERGRQQVTMAKMVGQFAVNHGQASASKRITKVQEQAEAILHEFGIAVPEPVAAPAPAAPRTPEPAVAAPSVHSGAGADQLPIADYDSLAASQVIPRLEGLSESERGAVRAYEEAHRGRKTILGKIDQLAGD